jgi:hypothetical protein
MENSTSGDTLSVMLVNEVRDASGLHVRTRDGHRFRAYEPITIGQDHISFHTTKGGNEVAFVKWEAITSLTVKK